MSKYKREKINIKGKKKVFDSYYVDGKTIIIKGNFLKVAIVKDEICDFGIDNPDILVEKLKNNTTADIFTFNQKLPHTAPKYKYYSEKDNFAVLKIHSFEQWWKNQIKNDVRRMVRKAEKKGVVVKVVSLDDELAVGIKSIYDELPLRQGKPFWYYNKDIAAVKSTNSSFIERSEFIGGYYKNELIGFVKMIYTGNRADLIQLLCKIKDRDKAPTNALIAKAIKICEQNNIRYLTYGNYSFGKKSLDSLADFKKRNGFIKIDVPRYYIPLTMKGSIAIKLNFHKSFIELIPTVMIDNYVKLRAKLYYKKSNKIK